MAESTSSAVDHRFLQRLRLKRLGISRAAVARLLKVSEMTVFRWENQMMAISPDSTKIILHLDAVAERLEYQSPDQILRWLETPTPRLDNFRPTDLLGWDYGMHQLQKLMDDIKKD